MTKKEQIKQEKTKALRELKRLCKGRRIYARVNCVSRSGMSREITFRVLKNNRLWNITGLIQKVTNYSWGRSWDGIRVSGCGMDMIFDTLYVVNSIGIKYGVVKKSKTKTDHENRYNGIVNTNYYSL